jgi:hypothetical protein
LSSCFQLSLSCWLARQNFIYVRPRLSMVDFAIAVTVVVVVGSIVGGLAWIASPIRSDITTFW